MAALPGCGRLRNGNGPDDDPGCGVYTHRVSMLKERGGRVDWSRASGLIAYDRLGEDGFFDVYTMALDGSRDTCLTCGKPGLPQRQNGNPAWHPSGNYIVFQSEVAASRASTFATHPGRGVNNVLWVTDPGGREFHQVTELSSSVPVLGVIHPHFSDDGGRLSWSEMYEEADVLEPGRFFGHWRLVVADFVVASGRPSVRNLRRFEPGVPGFYENHGFSPDGSRLIFSSNLGQSGLVGAINNDIFVLDLNTLNLSRLTDQGFNEHAHFVPSGRKIVWATNRDIPNRGTDLWIMNPDGGGKERLTFLNQQGCPEYAGNRAVPADSTTNSAGDKIVVYVQDEVLGEQGSIMLVELDRGF
jgi:Tol biopolymer transport system component